MLLHTGQAPRKPRRLGRAAIDRAWRFGYRSGKALNGMIVGRSEWIMMAFGAALLAVLASLVQSVTTAVARPPDAPADPITTVEERLRPLRQALPASGRVGYVTDVQGEDFTTGSIYLAQYALAPAVLVPTTEPPLVIGNFRTAQTALEWAKDQKLVSVRDYGNGLVLCRTNPQ